MSQPKGHRRLENLTAEQRADHDRITRAVRWITLVAFDREATDDPKDHGDQPYEPGKSLMDRERRGWFRAFYAKAWLGGLIFDVADGERSAVVMIDRQQAHMLVTGLVRWLAGTVDGWNRKPLRQYHVCPTCDGTGIRVDTE